MFFAAKCVLLANCEDVASMGGEAAPGRALVIAKPPPSRALQSGNDQGSPH